MWPRSPRSHLRPESTGFGRSTSRTRTRSWWCRRSRCAWSPGPRPERFAGAVKWGPRPTDPHSVVRTRSVLVKILRACATDEGDAVASLARHAPLDGLAALAIEHGVAGSVYRQIDRLEGLDSAEVR